MGRDQVPSDGPHLRAKVCMFILTRKDGTLLNATSMSEKDIVEICLTLGHTHPMGVLQYFAMEWVALFCTTEEMQWASHGAIKAMELWSKLIAIRVIPPSKHHIRAYIAAGEHSKLQSLPSEGEGEVFTNW